MTDTHNILTLSWSGGRSGEGRISSASIGGDLAIPARNGGTGAGLDPKSFLAASAAECLLLNLVTILEASNVEHGGISVETAAHGGGAAEISIIHHLTVLIADTSVTNDRIVRLIGKAEAACNIGNLLKSAGVGITLIHSISRG